MASAIPISPIDWRRAWRIIPSVYPPVGLFDTVASQSELDAVIALESRTNDRLRETLIAQLGQIERVPEDRRIFGYGTTPVMAAFAHLSPDGSRFAAPMSYGVYYAAHEEATAVAETVYHRERWLAESETPATIVQMRVYIARIRTNLHDIRGIRPKAHAPDSYTYSQELSAKLRAKSSEGIVYDSVRRPGGQCVAIFYPDVVGTVTQGAHFQYVWDGSRITGVLKLSAAQLT